MFQRDEMDVNLQRAIRVSLVEKLKKGERLTPSEVGMRDVLWGHGRKPDERDFRMPKWMLRGKNNGR
jgi:hypothetical protein